MAIINLMIQNLFPPSRHSGSSSGSIYMLLYISLGGTAEPCSAQSDESFILKFDL